MKNLGINFYHFLPTHLSTILLRKHGPISKSISKRYCQVVVLFSRLFCLVLVSIDYKKVERTPIEGRKGARRKTEIVQGLVTEFSLDIFLKIIKLARSTYYYHLKQLDQSDKDYDIKTEIQ